MKRTLLIGLMLLLILLPALSQTRTMSAAPLVQSPPTSWQYPRISIVWPGVNSPFVNVSVWPSSSVSCTAIPDLRLFRARNNEPAELVGRVGLIHMRHHEGVTFPTAEFNDIPMQMDSSMQYRFYTNGLSNIWVHGADPRTYYPAPVVPNGMTTQMPRAVDARIQIVWPHDGSRGVPVEQALFVNIAVDLFEHGTLKSVPIEPVMSANAIQLWVAENNGPLHQPTGGAAAVFSPYSINGQMYPRWVFNDVRVKPDSSYNYLVQVDGIETFPTIWTHARDARTYLPNPTTPPPCQP